MDLRQEQEHDIDLSMVSGVNMLKTGNKQTETKKSGRQVTEEHVDGIQLELQMKDGSRVALPFYNEIEDGILELLPLRDKAMEWLQLIKKDGC